ncbi:MAG TPA: SH3 domain-containing protein [Spirochaetia bacterium]|nr:SH3 domain-containing protein [Spirochaetia bacterium]
MHKCRVPLIAALLCAAAAAAGAQDYAKLPGFGTAVVGMIASDSVRLRSAPSTTGAVLRSLDTGELAVIAEQSPKPQKIGDGSYYWLHLKLTDGAEGWVYGQFVFRPVGATAAARIGARDYTTAGFLAAESADARGFSSYEIPALVDAAARRALPLKIAQSVASAAPMVGRSPEGWMTFSGDEATEVQIESVKGTGSASAQVLVAKKELDLGDGKWKDTARALLTCERRDDGKHPWFEVTKAETVPVN